MLGDGVITEQGVVDGAAVDGHGELVEVPQGIEGGHRAVHMGPVDAVEPRLHRPAERHLFAAQSVIDRLPEGIQPAHSEEINLPAHRLHGAPGHAADIHRQLVHPVAVHRRGQAVEEIDAPLFEDDQPVPLIGCGGGDVVRLALVEPLPGQCAVGAGVVEEVTPAEGVPIHREEEAVHAHHAPGRGRQGFEEGRAVLAGGALHHLPRLRVVAAPFQRGQVRAAEEQEFVEGLDHFQRGGQGHAGGQRDLAGAAVAGRQPGGGGAKGDQPFRFIRILPGAAPQQGAEGGRVQVHRREDPATPPHIPILQPHVHGIRQQAGAGHLLIARAITAGRPQQAGLAPVVDAIKGRVQFFGELAIVGSGRGAHWETVES